MAEGFREWDKQQHAEGQGLDDAEARMWELRILLAMTQQLTMIAQHLGEIVGKAKEKNNVE